MIRKRGFTLLEVLISLSIFMCVFSAILNLFFQFSSGNNDSPKCSAFTFILIQRFLTEGSSLIVSSSTDEAYVDDLVIHSEVGGLYFFKNKERQDFLKDKNNFQADKCHVLFVKNDTSINPVFNNSKCLDIKYQNNTNQVICALK